MKNRADHLPDEAIRLRRLRTACGFSTQPAFAEFLGLEHKRYANYENGFPLPREAVLALSRKIHGFSIDWLYLGREDGLSVALANKLRQAEAAGDDRGRGNRRRASQETRK